MKQPEWQRGVICGALSSTSQQLNLEPSEQREREKSPPIRNIYLNHSHAFPVMGVDHYIIIMTAMAVFYGNT